RCHFVQESFQRASVFTSFDEVYKEIVEVERVLCKSFVKRGAGFNVGFERKNQLLHSRFVMTVADDVEALNHRNTGLEHCRQLTREKRDILRGDLLAAFEY